MTSLKPMLGTSIDREDLIRHLGERGRLLASIKLDGIRALVRDGVVLSRSLKPIPNAHVQKLFGRPIFEGFDGELIVGYPNTPDVFRVTTSGVMSEDGEPDVKYYVFDLWNQPNTPFHQRHAEITKRVGEACYHHPIRGLQQTDVTNILEVEAEAERALRCGYEGLILRNPMSVYKYGRSTVREAGLLKVKPFVDAEARIVGFVEMMHNDNEAFTNALGRTERSTAKAGKRGAGTLGALVCSTPEGVLFEIGTGFDTAERQEIWNNQSAFKKRLVKYKSLIVGVKDKPRHAVFLGFRDARDTSE